MIIREFSKLKKTNLVLRKSKVRGEEEQKRSDGNRKEHIMAGAIAQQVKFLPCMCLTWVESLACQTNHTGL